MPFVSTGHIWLLLILLVVVLIIWGPGKLPDVGSGLGRAIREFRKASNDTKEEFARAARGDEHSAPTPSPVAPAGPVHDPEDVPPAHVPARAIDPLTPTAPTPEVPVVPAPGVAPVPAPLGTGPVLGSPPDAERI